MRLDKLHRIPIIQVLNLAQLRSINKKRLKLEQSPDKYKFSYIKEVITDSYKNIDKILFSVPISVEKAFECLLKSDHPKIKEELQFGGLGFMPRNDEISFIIDGLKKTPNIGKLMVNKIIGLGVFAFVFDIGHNKVLKITKNNHFPNNRPVEDFDAPVLEKGRLNNGKGAHYYIAKKLDTNLNKREILSVYERIKAKGYKVEDIFSYGNKYRKEQFGKDSKGNTYLIDPGCAIIP